MAYQEPAWWDVGGQLGRAQYYLSNGMDGRSEEEKRRAQQQSAATQAGPYGIKPSGGLTGLMSQGTAIADQADRKGILDGSRIKKAQQQMQGFGPDIGSPGAPTQQLSFAPAADVLGKAGSFATSPAGVKTIGAAAGLVGGARSLGYLGGGDAGAGGGSKGPLEQIYQQKVENERRNQERMDQLFQEIESRENPFAPGTEAFNKALAFKVNSTARAMKGAEHRTLVGLAGRGMMGSGQEAAAMTNLAHQRGLAMADAETSFYDRAQDRWGDWARSQDNARISLLNGSREDPTQLAMQMALWGRQDDQRREDQIGAIGKGAADWWFSMTPEERDQTAASAGKTAQEFFAWLVGQ